MFDLAFEYLRRRDKTASERACETQEEARLAAAAVIYELESAARNAESIRLAEAAKRARKCKRRRGSGA